MKETVSILGERVVQAALLLSVLMLLLQLAGDATFLRLRYDQFAIAHQGEWWRVLSGNFVHWTSAHTLMNVAGLLALAVIFSRDFSLVWWGVVLLLGSVAVGGQFLVLGGGMHYYAGFSGVLHGLLYFAVVAGYRRAPVLHGVVLVLLLGRLWMEHSPGYDINYLRAWINVSVAVNAHLAGAVTGGLLGLLFLWCASAPARQASASGPT